MQERLNCPNCGAVITGPICEYCGTVFDKSVYVQTKHLNVTAEEFAKEVNRWCNIIRGD